MSVTSAALQKLAARVTISPPPTTLGESTAVLKKLLTFGQITYFQKCEGQHESEDAFIPEAGRMTVDIAFSSKAALDQARRASPVTISVNLDLPDPAIEDPYNVRNLQSRRQPRSSIMTFHVDTQSATVPSGQNVFSRGFSPSVTTRLAQSFKDYHPPVVLTAALGVLQNDTVDLNSTPEFVEPVPDLVQMYRAQTTLPADLKGIEVHTTIFGDIKAEEFTGSEPSSENTHAQHPR